MRDSKGIYREQQRIRMPAEAADLKLRIAVEAHCRERGHRAFGATLEIVHKMFWWLEVNQKIKEFTQACVHCIISRNGERIQRPLSTALHGENLTE